MKTAGGTAVKTTQASITLFAFWLVISGSVAPLDLVIGVAYSVGLGWWAARNLWSDDAPTLSLRQLGRLLVYVPWLLKEIVVAAVSVAERVLDPRMPIDPVIITYRGSMQRDVSRVALANSITLTPGTLTVDVDENTFTVHCLAEEFADSIVSGAFERKVVRVFEG
ncbi:MAG: Na+/H+ antiporter subunit E [Coriobacteriia bacterium]|nr:Na+/H+ antiporter subunit E [Coriobacteriia bacterium]